MYKNFRQTADSLFLFCLAGLTSSAYKNLIGPKNDNGLLTCLRNTDQKYPLRKEKQVLKCFSLLKARNGANSQKSRLACFKSSTFLHFYSIPKENQLKIAFLNDQRRRRHGFVYDSVFVLLRFFEVPVSHF